MIKKLWWILFLILVIAVCLNFKSILRIIYPISYSAEVQKYATEYNLDENMVYALIRVESKFIPEAESGKGAIGLMQITTQTGKYLARLLHESDYDTAQLYNPDTNIRYGCFYFRKLLNDFHGDMNCALAAYNGGEGNVRKWAPADYNGNRTLDIKDIPFAETRKYVNKVNKYYKIYKYLYTDSNLLDLLNFI